MSQLTSRTPLEKLTNVIALLSILLLQGCARFPADIEMTTFDRLSIKFRTVGIINPSYHYFIVFEKDDDPSDGPLPALTRPWGNGWGVPTTLTHYIHINGGYASLFMNNPEDPFQPLPNGLVISLTSIEPNLMEVVINPEQFFGGTVPERIDLNFIAVNELILDPNFEGTRTYDALGIIGNDFINIENFNLGNFTVRDGDNFFNEEPGDASGSPTITDDLDFDYWEIIVERGT